MILSVVTIVGLSFCGHPLDEELIGTWKLEGLTLRGIVIKTEIESAQIDESTIKWEPLGLVDNYTLGNGRTSKSIDLSADGKLLLHGVYGFRGGKLIIHVANPSEPRPTNVLPMDLSKRNFIYVLVKDSQ